MRILGICGSLRAASSNAAVIDAAVRLAEPPAVVTDWRGLAVLPYFNPDDDNDERLPPTVRALRADVGRHDAVLICSPEYARGVAGSMKNALDWLVGSSEFPNKPVAVINTSQRATHADSALKLTLETMSARLIGDACITLPLLGRGLDSDGIVADPNLSAQIKDAVRNLAAQVAG